MSKIIPTAVVVLAIGACIGYAFTKDYRMSLYWFGVAVVNAAVTF